MLMNIAIADFTVNIPDDYIQMNPLPGDPVGSMSFSKQTNNSACLAMYSAIPSDKAMPFNSRDQVIAGIRGSLAQDQGIIEVETGITNSGKKYIYSIVKTVNRGSIGVQYSLMMHIGYYADHVFQVEGFFDETGYTGGRDTAVFAILQKDGKIGPNYEGWAEDPYDPEFKQGILMNASERENFDEAFPEHPLTQARILVKTIVAVN